MQHWDVSSSSPPMEVGVSSMVRPMCSLVFQRLSILALFNWSRFMSISPGGDFGGFDMPDQKIFRRNAFGQIQAFDRE